MTGNSRIIYVSETDPLLRSPSQQYNDSYRFVEVRPVPIIQRRRRTSFCFMLAMVLLIVFSLFILLHLIMPYVLNFASKSIDFKINGLSLDGIEKGSIDLEVFATTDINYLNIENDYGRSAVKGFSKTVQFSVISPNVVSVFLLKDKSSLSTEDLDKEQQEVENQSKKKFLPPNLPYKYKDLIPLGDFTVPPLTIDIQDQHQTNLDFITKVEFKKSLYEALKQLITSEPTPIIIMSDLGISLGYLPIGTYSIITEILLN